MGRYSLEIENTDTKETVLVPFQEYNKNKMIKETKTKVELSTIDSGTLCFYSEEQLLNYFREKGLINFDHANIYITYQLNGKKYLPIVYKNYSGLAHFARNGMSMVNTHDLAYEEVIDDFLDNCKRKTFFRYMKDKRFLNKYLIEKINDYVYNPENNQYTDNEYAFLRSKIAQNMSSYKTFRGIYIGKTQYELYDAIKYGKYRADNYDDMIDTYNKGGYDAIYSQYDLDELTKAPDDVQKKLGLKY